MSQKSVQVLLIDDDPADIRLIQECFKRSSMAIDLHVEDGEKAVEYLRKRAEVPSGAYPDLILLDLNMPKKDGRQLLSELKMDKDLKRIPVVVLTTSDAETDIIKSYNLGANCYITKPVDFDQFSRIVDLITEFWLKTVKLPSSAVENFY